MLRISVVLALLALCPLARAQAPSPQNSLGAPAPAKSAPAPMAAAPFDGAQGRPMQPLGYQLMPANPNWYLTGQPQYQQVQAYAIPAPSTPPVVLAMHAAPMAQTMAYAQPMAAVYSAAPTAAPCTMILGPGPVSQTLAAVGRRMATLGQKQWVIQRIPISPVVAVQPVVAPVAQPTFVPQPPVMFATMAPAQQPQYQLTPAPPQPQPSPLREAAPPPPVVPSAQKQASVWPPSRPEF